MSSQPLLIVQANPEKLLQDKGEQAEIIAIAVYGKDQEAPPYVTTKRIFDGETKFPFPTEITFGATKTRIVYRYTYQQWQELLSSLTLPSTPEGLKQLMIPLLLYLQAELPEHFQHISYDDQLDPARYAEIMTME